MCVCVCAHACPRARPYRARREMRRLPKVPEQPMQPLTIMSNHPSLERKNTTPLSRPGARGPGGGFWSAPHAHLVAGMLPSEAPGELGERCRPRLCMWSLSPSRWCSTGGNLGPLPPQGRLALPIDTGTNGGLLLASSGWRPEMLLRILQGTEWPPAAKSYPARNTRRAEAEKPSLSDGSAGIRRAIPTCNVIRQCEGYATPGPHHLVTL